MKPVPLLMFFLAMGAMAQAQDDFMNFQVRTFTREDAEQLASAEFMVRYGACGTISFKERRFEAWIFETRVGYGGTPADDIVVFSTLPSRVPDILAAAPRTQPGQLTRLPPTAGLPVAEQLFLAETGEHSLSREYSLPAPR